jgi:hypothetical protein
MTASLGLPGNSRLSDGTRSAIVAQMSVVACRTSEHLTMLQQQHSSKFQIHNTTSA